jgi:hypothetical protein
MATATRAKSRSKTRHRSNQVLSDRGRHEGDSSQVSPLSTQICRESEPLEGALRGKEAPEAWQSRQSEAPDAGQGADSSMDEPFTHGRSKS